MEILLLVVGILVGTALGFFISKSRTISSSDTTKLNDLEREKAILQDRLNAEKSQSERMLTLVQNEKEKVEKELLEERERSNQNAQSLERSRAFFKAQEEKIIEQKSDIEKLQEKFNKEFELIANKILDDKSQKFTEQNRNNLDNILNPLKEKIKDFEEKVDKSYKSEAAERNTLKGSIEELMKLNKQISEEANNLTKALKGDTKKQGNWGELVLAKILEASGLGEGQGYTLQGKGMILTDENGNRLQPDVIVHLPDQKHIVIDAKVSLVAYERLVNSTDDNDRESLIRQHILSIKNHINGLSGKNYQDLYGINSPEFVLLFVPIESSFSIAIQNDQDLWDFAWGKRVVIVTPSTLLATLKTVSSIWKQEQQTKNAIDIATKAGALYDKFVGFISDLKKIGDQLDKSKDAYNEAFNKLQSGSGNLIGRVENLRKLGAKATKQIDQKLMDEEE